MTNSLVILLATVKGLHGFNSEIVLTGCQLLDPISKTLTLMQSGAATSKHRNGSMHFSTSPGSNHH